VPQFMDFHQDLDLPAAAIAQIAAGTGAGTAGDSPVTRADAVRGAVGPWDRFCSALGHPGASGGGSVAVITLASGVVPIKFRSRILNEILAFDMAEFLGHLRQVNTIVVSSFAGPECTLWGYDAARHEALDEQAAVLTVERHDGKMIPVRPLQPLLAAGDALLGAYPLFAGTVTPCALRTITAPGPCVVSAALGVGIAEHRGRDADLFMEDARVQRRRCRPGAGRADREWAWELAASIVAVGAQQGVLYKEIFAGATSAQVPAGSFGGAVAGIPYCLLPRAAVPDDPAALLDPVTWSQARWRAQHAPAGPPA
jgi:histidine decarboxylase